MGLQRCFCGSQFGIYREDIEDVACDECYEKWQLDHLNLTLDEPSGGKKRVTDLLKENYGL